LMLSKRSPKVAFIRFTLLESKRIFVVSTLFGDRWLKYRHVQSILRKKRVRKKKKKKAERLSRICIRLCRV
jgi:hypothetical protein